MLYEKIRLPGVPVRDARGRRGRARAGRPPAAARGRAPRARPPGAACHFRKDSALWSLKSRKKFWPRRGARSQSRTTLSCAKKPPRAIMRQHRIKARRGRVLGGGAATAAAGDTLEGGTCRASSVCSTAAVADNNCNVESERDTAVSS